MSEKKILLFGFSDSLGKSEAMNLRGMLRTQNISVEVIGREQYLKPIGELAGIRMTGAAGGGFPGMPLGEYRGPELPVRLLIICGMEHEELDHLLEICARCGITKEDLKAVLTPVNASWNAVGLCNELQKEHRQMRR